MGVRTREEMVRAVDRAILRRELTFLPGRNDSMWLKDGREYTSIGKEKTRRWYIKWKCDGCKDCTLRREDQNKTPCRC